MLLLRYRGVHEWLERHSNQVKNFGNNSRVSWHDLNSMLCGKDECQRMYRDCPVVTIQPVDFSHGSDSLTRSFLKRCSKNCSPNWISDTWLGVATRRATTTPLCSRWARVNRAKQRYTASLSSASASSPDHASGILKFQLVSPRNLTLALCPSLFLSFLFTVCCLAAQAMMQLKTPLKTISGMFFPLSNIDDAENFNSLPCLCENRLIVFTLKTRRACRSSATIR